MCTRNTGMSWGGGWSVRERGWNDLAALTAEWWTDFKSNIFHIPALLYGAAVCVCAFCCCCIVFLYFIFHYHSPVLHLSSHFMCSLFRFLLFRFGCAFVFSLSPLLVIFIAMKTIATTTTNYCDKHKHKTINVNLQGRMLPHNISQGVIISNHSLVLQGVSRATAGNYSCVGFNAEGDGISPPFTLNVLCKSSILYIYSRHNPI